MGAAAQLLGWDWGGALAVGAPGWKGAGKAASRHSLAVTRHPSAVRRTVADRDRSIDTPVVKTLPFSMLY